MLFHIVIIVCLVPINFCKQAQNQYVGRSSKHLKKIPEKLIQDIEKLIKENNNYHVATPIVKGTRRTHKNVLPQHTLENAGPKTNQHLNKRLGKTLVTSRMASNNSAYKKHNITNKPSEFPKKNQKEAKVDTVTTDQLQKESRTKTITDDANTDTKEKLLLTTQSVKVKSQIEKPILEHQEDSDGLLGDHNDENKKHVYLEDERRSSYGEKEEINRTEVKPDISSETLHSIASYDMLNQLEPPIIDNIDLKTYNVDEELAVLKNTTISKPKDVELGITNIKRITVPLKEKKMALFPLPLIRRAYTPTIFDEQFNDTQKSQPAEKIDDENNDVHSNINLQDDSIKNENTEVFEMKQINYTEVVENQGTPIGPIETFNSIPASQNYETRTSNYDPNYNLDTGLNSPCYRNLYQYKDGPFNYQTNSLFDEYMKKIRRNWVNTEIVIKTMKNKPNDLDKRPVIQRNTPVWRRNYNQFYDDNQSMYTFYPCYVYPSICYASTNGY